MSSLSPTRGHVALRGLAAVALGTTLAVWPGITIGTVIALFAVYAVFDAAVSISAAFRHGVAGSDRALLGLRAVIELIAAGVAVAWPGATASVMTVILGISVVTTGGLELAVTGRLARAGATGLGRPIAAGVLAVMTGVALVVWPGIGAVTLAIVFGIHLALAGVMLLVSAATTPRGQRVAEAM
jgi:uncharacterized membrane protein HdeD (DUF308 family)